jgi:hypothetical protein
VIGGLASRPVEPSTSASATPSRPAPAQFWPSLYPRQVEHAPPVRRRTASHAVVFKRQAAVHFQRQRLQAAFERVYRRWRSPGRWVWPSITPAGCVVGVRR